MARRQHGQPMTFTLSSGQQVKAGEIVLFGIGHESRSEMCVNDVSGFSEANCKWLFHSVQLGPSP